MRTWSEGKMSLGKPLFFWPGSKSKLSMCSGGMRNTSNGFSLWLSKDQLRVRVEDVIQGHVPIWRVVGVGRMVRTLLFQSEV